MKEIAILGSTGSIGTQTLDIVRIYPRLFHVSVISAKRNIDALFAQAEEFHPHTIVVTDEILLPVQKERRGRSVIDGCLWESSGSCPCFRGRH